MLDGCRLTGDGLRPATRRCSHFRRVPGPSRCPAPEARGHLPLPTDRRADTGRRRRPASASQHREREHSDIPVQRGAPGVNVRPPQTRYLYVAYTYNLHVPYICTYMEHMHVHVWSIHVHCTYIVHGTQNMTSFSRTVFTSSFIISVYICRYL